MTKNQIEAILEVISDEFKHDQTFILSNGVIVTIGHESDWKSSNEWYASSDC